MGDKVYTKYGTIGGVGAEIVEEDKIEANSQNEWEKEIKQYLLSGQLQGGTLAVRNRHKAQSPRRVSQKQRAALRR